MKSVKNNKKSAQEIQDEIFRNMTADKKIQLASQLWSLAKELSKDKVYYGINRPKTAVGKSS